MEDILNSIRRIMADDHKDVPAPAHAEPGADAHVEGSIEDDIKALRGALNAIRGEMDGMRDDLAAPAGAVEEQAVASDAEDAGRTEEGAGLVSTGAEQAVRRSFADLSRAATLRQELDVDALAENLLRPMLQQWLDAHLPALVEKLVREEISRLSGSSG